MKTSNYLYVSHSQMYGMLHGMHTGGCLDNITLEDTQARTSRIFAVSKMREELRKLREEN